MDLELNKQDFIVMSILFITCLVLSCYNLGASQIPSTSWSSSGTCKITLKLHSPMDISSLYALLSDGKTVEFSVFSGSPGNWSYTTTFRGSGYFQWLKVDIERTSQHILLSFPGRSGNINEFLVTSNTEGIIDLESTVIIFDGANPDGVENLFDEQRKLRLPITSFSQAYFDEIYFVRAAEDYIESREPYEWTHPPLGKLLIALGILFSGFSPFGWRILCVFFSALMLPVTYIFSLKIFQSRTAGFISGSLILLDFMHFTMGRIGITETFAVFFNLVSCFFFYVNYRHIQYKGEIKKSAILLGSIFFALAFSTKWYTIFGLIGQISLILSIYLNSNKLENRFVLKIRNFILNLIPVFLISFFASILIYFSTYIPYMLQGHSLIDVYGLQWEMLRYHSTLMEVHPYSSPWWSWPFNIRPLWLTIDFLQGDGVSTVVAMGNPVIWWLGFLQVISIAERAVRSKDKTSIFITVTFLSQWLPYALMTRCLFIYHFYVNLPILILAITLLLNEALKEGNRKKFVLTYLVATIVFALFYPVISGHPIPSRYRLLLRWLPSWAF